jgi:hypothetical protein
MVAFAAHVNPAFGFQFFDELLTIHALDNTHEYTLRQVIRAVLRRGGLQGKNLPKSLQWGPKLERPGQNRPRNSFYLLACVSDYEPGGRTFDTFRLSEEFGRPQREARGRPEGVIINRAGRAIP